MIFGKIIRKLLSERISIEDRNDPEEIKFLNNLSTNKGWKSYVAFRDLALMKEMAKGVSDKKYTRLLGQREELVYLVNHAIKYKRLKDKEPIDKMDMEIKGVDR